MCRYLYTVHRPVDLQNVTNLQFVLQMVIANLRRRMAVVTRWALITRPRHHQRQNPQRNPLSPTLNPTRRNLGPSHMTCSLERRALWGALSRNLYITSLWTPTATTTRKSCPRPAATLSPLVSPSAIPAPRGRTSPSGKNISSNAGFVTSDMRSWRTNTAARSQRNPSLQPYQQEAVFGGGSDVSNGIEPDSSERSHDDDGYEEASPKLPTHHNHSLSPPGQQMAPPIEQHDRIVGHEFGVKPLLDDDELSDTEGKPSVMTNPFLTQDEALSQCSSVMSTGSVTMSPQSSLSPVDVINRDVFGAATFQAEITQETQQQTVAGQPATVRTPPHPVCSPTPGPCQPRDRKWVVWWRKGRTNWWVSPPWPTVSPQTPPTCTPPLKVPRITEMPLCRACRHQQTPTCLASETLRRSTPANPRSRSSACNTRGHHSTPVEKTTSPSNRTSVSFDVDPFGITPFTANAFHADLTQPHLMPGSATKVKVDSLRASNYGSGHGVASHGMQRRHRRHSSSESHSSSSDVSPHTAKKDGQKITRCYSKGSDLLQDENVEVLPSGDFSYGSLKKSKQKTKKSRKPSAEFANLGFTDDIEREAELTVAARKCSGNVELPVNSAMHQSLLLDPLKSSNIGNYMAEVDGGGATSGGSSHTLPRARKHLVMPQQDKMSTDFFQW